MESSSKGSSEQTSTADLERALARMKGPLGSDEEMDGA